VTPVLVVLAFIPFYDVDGRSFDALWDLYDAPNTHLPMIAVLTQITCLVIVSLRPHTLIAIRLIMATCILVAVALSADIGTTDQQSVEYSPAGRGFSALMVVLALMSAVQLIRHNVNKRHLAQLEALRSQRK
jgi:Mn2+/Fe2+ NRAMP family transporter